MLAIVIAALSFSAPGSLSRRSVLTAAAAAPLATSTSALAAAAPQEDDLLKELAAVR